MKTKFTARTVGNYGCSAHPLILGVTQIESEGLCSDYGRFERKGEVRHVLSKQLVRVRADIADTWFSIPATTATENGYVTSREEADGSKELVFIPYTSQNERPAQYRARVRKESR